MGGYLIPDLLSGPLRSVLALLACMFIASVKRASDYAHLYLVPVRCQLSRSDSQVKPTLVVQYEVFNLDNHKRELAHFLIYSISFPKILPQKRIIYKLIHTQYV